VTTNYKIGWVSNGEWFNYKRTIPAGVYTAYSAGGADPIGTDIGGTLGIVTSGAGSSSQSVYSLGHFTGPSRNTWGDNNLVPLKVLGSEVGQTYGAQDTVFKLAGGEYTIRYTTRSGDLDWFTLAPVTGKNPVLARQPRALNSYRRDATLTWEIRDGNVAVNLADVKLMMGAAGGTLDDYTPAATIAPLTGPVSGVSVTFAAPEPIEPGVYAWQLMWNPGQMAEGTVTATVYPAPGAFVIEAEDFDYNTGQFNPLAGTTGQDVNVMPYLGGAYAGLDAAHTVDYGSNDGEDSPLYRDLTGQNKNMNDNLGGLYGADRGTFNVTTNYKLGWTDTSDWGNYTREFPEGNFNVFAALSFGGRDADGMRATLALVSDGVGTPDQTLVELGRFLADGSGDWGRNELVPLTNTEGNLQVVSMGGVQTVRFTMDSGDFDYFLLVPTDGVAQPKFTSITVDAGNITIEWTGGGVLEAAEAVTGPWAVIEGATSPYTTALTGTMRVFRVSQ
jgi:hypothetical protein